MKKLLILEVTFIMAAVIFAQQPAKEWTKKFTGNVKWYQISDAVIVSKVDGKNMSSMMLGDKTPDYKLDELGRMIFQKSDNDEIKGFKF